jgi:hypothetical protein
MIDMCTLDAIKLKEKFVLEKKSHFVAIEFTRNKINFTNKPTMPCNLSTLISNLLFVAQ